MPRPDVSTAANPGLAIHVVDGQEVARVQRLIHREDIDELERYLRSCGGRGMLIKDWPATVNTDKILMMVCFVERVTPNIRLSDEDVSASFSSPIHQVMGLPVIESSVFSMIRGSSQINFGACAYDVLPTIPRNSDYGMNRFHINSLDDISFVRDEEGRMVVKTLSDHHSLNSVASGTDLQTNELIFNNERMQEEGWTSIRMRRVEGDSDIVSFVLDNIPEEQRMVFAKEVDEMGWTSLHWSCYENKKEVLNATMSRLPSAERMGVATMRTTDEKGWTLLHATAVKDAGETMKALIKKFPDDGKWRLLTCQSNDRCSTALHIAVAEKNVKAAIILLDAANDRRGELLEIRDRDRQKASDFTSEDSLLGKYFRFAADTTGSMLHEATERDNITLVSFILDNLSETSVKEAVTTKNESEMTVLHLAAKYGSVLVLELLLSLLDEEGFVKCARERSTNADTAMHLAARFNQSKSLHLILKAVRPEHRADLLQMVNERGETIKDAGSVHGPILNTLKYHEWIINQQLLDFFKEFDFSLFNVQLTENQTKDLYKVIENRSHKELGYVRCINYDAAKCLMHGDLNKAERLTDLARRLDPTSIHALCNRGVYMLKRGDSNFRSVEDIALKVLELYSDQSGKARLCAKIDFAYFLAETERTDAAREQSCDIFEECRQEAGRCVDSQAMAAYCSYFYARILIRSIQSKSASKYSQQWFTDKINKTVSQFVTLSRADQHLYGADLWLWIAELQSPKIPRVAASAVRTGIRRITTECFNDEYWVDPESCVNRAIDMRSEYEYEIKLIIRIAKLCLDVAYLQRDVYDHQHWMTMSLQLCDEMREKSSEWNFMSASTSTQALLRLWAIEFFSNNDFYVEQQYYNQHGHYLDRSRYSSVISFLVSEYYWRGLRRDRLTRKYLVPAKNHLLKLVENNGWYIYGVRLARVKYILGDPQMETVATFEKSLQFINNDMDRGKCLQAQGLFYEHHGKRFEAKRMYKRAIEISRTTCKSFYAEIAYRGVNKLIRY